MRQSFAAAALVFALLTPAPSAAQSTPNATPAAPSATPSPTEDEAQRLNAEVLELYRKGDYGKAQPLAERVLALRRQAHGGEHPLVGAALFNLAKIYAARGKKKEARETYLASVAVLERGGAATEAALVGALEGYLCLLVEAGERAESLAVQKRLYKLDNGFEYDESTKRPGKNIEAGGIMTGSKVLSPAPTYLAEAKQRRITGRVVFKISVDETGAVTGVKVLCGHPLLVQGSEQSIRTSRYQPPLVAGRPAKVTGVQIYNFTMN